MRHTRWAAMFLLLMAALPLSSDTRSKCLTQADQAYNECLIGADSTLEGKLSLHDAQFATCMDMFANPGWIACRETARFICGDDEACLATKNAQCKQTAEAACAEERNGRRGSAYWMWDFDKQACSTFHNNATQNCPLPGLCNTADDCQDMNPGYVCSFDGHCVASATCSGTFPICDFSAAFCGEDGVWTCGEGSPIILDLNGDGFDLTSVDLGVRFDLNRDRTREKIAWTARGSDDAWLVLDRNGNGTIDDGGELFGNFTAQPRSARPNGFLALAEFDKRVNGGNGDGLISQRDSAFTKLRLWRDLNHNGLSEPRELLTLAAADVVALSLDFKETKWVDRNGNRFAYRARVRTEKSSDVAHWAYDVFLVTKP